MAYRDTLPHTPRAPRPHRAGIAAALGGAAVLLLPPSYGTIAAQPPAATPTVETFNPRDRIPFDRSIRAGTLPNGVSYFIRENRQPANRVSLRLSVKAGSIEESDAQKGLAHLVEHMAFEGSAHFNPGEILTYFESVGARLGPHVNAATNFDDTMYMLDVPADKPAVIEKALIALADFGGGLKFGESELEKERGVVIEEWRRGLGASSRVRDKQLPVLLYQSRYAERLPIGKPEIIRSASVDQLRAFYDTWYRPERMAVIVVGDVNARQLEPTLTFLFSPLKARAPAAPDPGRTLPLNRELLVNVVTDPEVTQSVVQIVRKRPKAEELTVAGYRRQLVERLVQQMLNERFGELARKPDAKFLGALASDQTLTAGTSMFAVSAGVRNGEIEGGLRALTAETTRARRFGFGPSELDRAKKSTIALYEREFAERDKADSGTLAAELIRHFLVDEPVPGIDYEYRLASSVLSNVSTDDVNATARALLADDSRVVLAVSPQKQGVSVPSETELRSALLDAERAEVSAWADTTISRPLVDPKPEPAAIESRREIPGVGVTSIRFANGVEAWLKPTDFKNDQVLFSMEAPGGASLAPPQDYLAASLAPAYVLSSGAAGMSASDLQKVTAGRRASAVPFARLSAHGFSGGAAPADLETALQLLYAQFTVPGHDAQGLALIKRRLQETAANRGQSPAEVFSERLEEVNTSSHYTSAPPTVEQINALDGEKMLAFYRQWFSNAADFAFVMVGAFKVDDVAPLLARYIGSLPSTGRKTSGFKDVGIHFPAATERVQVQKGQEPLSRTVISFYADPPPDPVERENVSAATTVLEGALRDILREELGQTYSVSVRLEQPLPQRGAGHIAVSFAAAPENIDGMIERSLREIQRLQRDGPSSDVVERAKELARRIDETDLRQNGHWMNALLQARMRGRDPVEVAQRNDRIDRVTRETVQRAFAGYFPFDRFTVVTLIPQQSR
jgi:zinc protease